MYLFKYYRPDVYFEKAMRYNELYFASNSQLNDPNDLKINYEFPDDVEFWKTVLHLAAKIHNPHLKSFFTNLKPDFCYEMNYLFKNLTFSGNLDSLRSLFDTLQLKIKNITIINSALVDVNSPYHLIFSLYLQQVIEGMIYINFHSVSFSTEALDPMMWAYYADGFNGCVVIYKMHTNENGTEGMYLKDNIFSSNENFLPIEKIIYDSGRKDIILTHNGIDKKALKIKNSFWSHEKEFRFISYEKSDFTTKKNATGRIFHHRSDAIAGVIFGAKCDDAYKEKISSIINENRKHLNSGEFCHYFNTQLTNTGKIDIGLGLISNYSMPNSFHNGRIILTNEILDILGIHQPND